MNGVPQLFLLQQRRKTMKSKGKLCVLIVLALTLWAVPGLAGEGTTDPDNVQKDASVGHTWNPSIIYQGAKHVANGAAMRNEARGTIALRGVPEGSSVAKAWLFWNYSDGEATGAATDVVLFNGDRYVGSKRADNADPCWSMAGNHTYRADVTRSVPSSRPNGDYEMVIEKAVSTTGQNPWTPNEAQTVRIEGASLLVIYKSANTVDNTVYLYDALSASTFSSGTGTFVLLHPDVSSSGLYTMCGADGQRGVGSAYTNGASNETGFFDGVQISGPSVAASDWDGSAGWPLVQLWDVHTHQVTLSGTASKVLYRVGSDCLTPVFFVLQSGV